MRLIPEEMRIKQINTIPNIAFVSWVDGHKGNTSKANVRCSNDGFEWIATPSGLINQNLGCPQCSGKRRWTAKERIEQINKLEGIEFVSWHGCYKNKNSKANVRCLVDGTEWASCVNNLVNGLQRCPKCSRISGGISRRVCGNLWFFHNNPQRRNFSGIKLKLIAGMFKICCGMPRASSRSFSPDS